MRASVLALCLAACGLSDGVLLSELSESQQEQFCEEQAADVPTETFVCEQVEIAPGEFADFEITPDMWEFSLSYCLDNPVVSTDDCTATVADVRACNATFTTDPCWQFRDELHPDCAAYYDCL